MSLPRTLVCCAMLLSLASGCSKKPYSPENRAEDEQTIRRLESDFSQAITAKNIDKLVSMYSDDGALYDEREPILKGKSAIRETWTAAFAKSGAEIKAEPRTVEIAEDGRLAWAHGLFTLTNLSGHGPESTQWDYAFVYTRQPDGNWKITTDSGNSGLQTNLFGRPLKEHSKGASMAPLIGLGCSASLLWFVIGMPILAIVGASKSYQKRKLTTGLIVSAAMAAAFFIAAILLWRYASVHYWNLPLKNAFAASVDTARYGNPVEDTAEAVLVTWIVFSTLAASAAGVVTGIARWAWGRRRRTLLQPQ